MTLATPSIREVASTRPALYAFRITGEVSRADMAAMGERMIEAFDAHDDPVDMLLIFERYEGAEAFAGLSWPAVRSRVEALSHVGRYVTAAAPEAAARLIETLDALIPVEAHAVATEAEAWALLGAEPR